MWLRIVGTGSKIWMVQYCQSILLICFEIRERMRTQLYHTNYNGRKCRKYLLPSHYHKESHKTFGNNLLPPFIEPNIFPQLQARKFIITFRTSGKQKKYSETINLSNCVYTQTWLHINLKRGKGPPILQIFCASPFQRFTVQINQQNEIFEITRITISIVSICYGPVTQYPYTVILFYLETLRRENPYEKAH